MHRLQRVVGEGLQGEGEGALEAVPAQLADDPVEPFGLVLRPARLQRPRIAVLLPGLHQVLDERLVGLQQAEVRVAEHDRGHLVEAEVVQLARQALAREAAHLLADRAAPVAERALVGAAAVGLHQRHVVAEPAAAKAVVVVADEVQA